MSYFRYPPPSTLPPRVLAALNYLSHCESITSQTEASIPARSLDQGEERVRRSALRVLSLYFEGEMDFGDTPPAAPRRDEEPPDGGVPQPVA